MATKSRIVEPTFRFGSGRYIQESGAARRLAEEVLRLGCKRPFLMGGKTALSLALPSIQAGLAEKEMAYSVYTYTGFCCVETCEALMASPDFSDCDIVVGIGGGNVCDAAKLVAVQSGRPVILIPTSSATCASFTPLSVTYTKEFRCAGTKHHSKEVDGVIVDMSILCRQPERLLAAGVYDAAAKLIESEQRIKGVPEDELDVGFSASFALSHYTYDRMFKLFEGAVEALNSGKENKALYDLVYLTIAATGLISSMARGSNQCALAHKIYENLRTLFPNTVKAHLHGELVAIGLLVQLYYNGRENEIDAFRRGMRSHGLPVSMTELGIDTADGTALQALYDKLIASTAMAETTEAEHKLLERALEVIR